MEDSDIRTPTHQPHAPRSPTSAELSKVVDFLNKNLRLNVTWPIHKEYPTALNSANLHNLSIIADETEGKILSHALLRPFICKTPQAILKIGAIGSVVTDPSMRHQGLSTKNLENCLLKANAQECDVVVLWSDQYDFYRKLGFELAGFEHSFIVSKPPTHPSPDLKFVKGLKIDPAAILKLYNQHTVNSIRTVDEIHQYLNIPNSHVYTLWNPQNQLVAYAIEGKGIDLQNYIHEWGGPVSDLMDLLSYMIQSEKATYTFMCPQHSLNLKNRLNTISDYANQGFLGLIKITNFDRLAAKIKKIFLAEGFDQITLEKKNNEIIFGHKTDLYTLKNEADFVKIVFGPTQIKDMAFISHPTARVLEKVFPLPLWIWGWDSV